MSLSLEQAKKIVARATVKAKELGVKNSYAILDEWGHLMLLERMDGAAWITSEIAVGKAYTAVAFRLIGERFTDTEEIGRYFSNTPSFLTGLAVSTHGKIIGRGGGIPILIDGKVVGGLGISGGKAEQDHACAKAGLDFSQD